jgi:ATP adenylyltransferase
VKPDCSFCARQGSRATEQTALLESDEFVAWPSLGALVEGWILVLPKAHHLSVRDLDPDAAGRFQAFLAQAAGAVRSRYGPVAIVEHGPIACGSPAGCSIDHAHAHVVPWSGSLRGPLSALCPALEWRAVPDLKEFPAWTDPGAPYLLLSSVADGTLVGVAQALPSQLVRRAIAAELGEPDEFDWKRHPRVDVVRATVESLAAARSPA